MGVVDHEFVDVQTYFHFTVYRNERYAPRWSGILCIIYTGLGWVGGSLLDLWNGRIRDLCYFLMIRRCMRGRLLHGDFLVLPLFCFCSLLSIFVSSLPEAPFALLFLCFLLYGFLSESMVRYQGRHLVRARLPCRVYLCLGLSTSARALLYLVLAWLAWPALALFGRHHPMHAAFIRFGN